MRGQHIRQTAGEGLWGEGNREAEGGLVLGQREHLDPRSLGPLEFKRAYLVQIWKTSLGHQVIP